MSLVINSNFSATLAANNLAASNQALHRSLARLASGSKIVNPADDAGGLAVSMKLTATARRQAATGANIGNAVSFLQTQDGALKIAGKLLERIGELKTLSLDVTKSPSDIANYDEEFSSLQAQLTALGSEKFNGVALFGSTSLDVRTTEDGTTAITLEGIDLLHSGGGVTNLTLTSSIQSFTPDGAGTLTVTSGDLDFSDTGNTYLDNGQSASYDGAGNWTLPTGRDPVTGTSINISELTTSGTATFTTSASATSAIAGAANLAAVSVTTIAAATANIATHRASNGANQSRLGFAAELLAVNRANLEAATSRITDVDVAAESTQLARYNILVQAGTSMLSQANQSPQGALKLLG